MTDEHEYTTYTDHRHLQVHMTYCGITKTDVAEWLKTNPCAECEKRKKPEKVGPTTVIHSKEFGERAQVDLVDFNKLPSDGGRYACVYKDHYTKMMVAIAIPKKEWVYVMQCLLLIWQCWVVPKILQCDNGVQCLVLYNQLACKTHRSCSAVVGYRI